LANISKNKNNYDILVQLNKFSAHGKLLQSISPINISDSILTGTAKLSTSGYIAYDIWHNLAGQIDMTFNGGNIIGLGLDNFYAHAQSVTKTNAEMALRDALDNGTSRIKNLHIIGDYNGGEFQSTEPFTLSLRHTNATGTIQTINKNMTINIDMLLRGTSPSPQSVQLEIMPNGKRNYSLSQIMINFDPDDFREFRTTHTRS
jgi:hypothetical protein